ncbi:MAG: XdhC family protein [Anaerolineales bacterium]|nr:XdhC family protein [Anaerolineales bacterium]
MEAVFRCFLDAIRAAQLVALVTVIDGPRQGAKLVVWPGGKSEGSLGDPTLDENAVRTTLLQIERLQPAQALIETAGETAMVFIDVQPPPPKLIVVGAVHMAIPLITFARTLGYHTTVIDPRSAFATSERFGHADRLCIGWPTETLRAIAIDEATSIVVVTHDEKIDDPALVFACRSPARYIGALGSRRTHAARTVRLRALGLADAEIARIRAPIGLPIGARRPEEIAVSIIAEIIAVANLASAEESAQ